MSVNNELVVVDGQKKYKEIPISALFYPVIFVLVSLLAEMVNFVYLGYGLLPKYIIFDLAFFLFGAGLIYLAPKKWMKLTIFYVFFVLQIVLNCVNVTMNNIFGDILSFDMLKLGGEAVSAFSLEFLDFVNIAINILLLVVSILLIKGIDKKIDLKAVFNKKRKYALLMCGILVIWGCCGSFFFLGRESLQEVEASTDLYIVESDVYLYDSLFLKTEAFKKFGTYGFYLKSLENLVFVNENDINRKDLDAFVNQGEGYKANSNYSSVAQDDNLIVIMLESFEWFAIDPIYTPTLYSLRTEIGYSLENFYGRNKTNVSEDISILGSMPKNSMMIDYYEQVGITVPYSLPNLYKSNNENASVNYYHSYIETFYNRNVVNKALGFDDVIGLEETKIKNKSEVFGEWVKDSDFVTANLGTIVPENDEKFFSFYTTIGTHGSYDKELDAYEEYYDIFDDRFDEYKEYLKTTDYVLPENDNDLKHLRNYKSTAMDTDRTVKIIMDRLEELGKLDETTIVLFSDHNCYYHDTTNHVKGIEKSEYYNIELYNIPFIIYNDGITPEQNYTFCNTYDIYPTICDLMGFEYNSMLAQGYSVFSEEIKNSVFISFLNGIFSEKYYTTNVIDVIELVGNTSDDELLEFQLNVVNFYLKQQQIENIFKINYFDN